MQPLKSLRRALVTAALLVAAATSPALAGDGTTLEVVISKPKAGVTLEALLAIDKTMEQEFVVKQPGFVSREVAVSKDGEVIIIVHWATLADAEAAGAGFMNDPAGKARLEASDASLFKHYIQQ